jgi:hypothetical protein
VLRIIHRVIAGFRLKQAGLKRATADAGAFTLIQRFGSAANLNIHLHCLVHDGVYRRTEGEAEFQEARAPSRDELAGLLDKIIARLMKMLTLLGYGFTEQGGKPLVYPPHNAFLWTAKSCAPSFIAEPMSRDLGQPIFIDNQPGASATIAVTFRHRIPACCLIRPAPAAPPGSAAPVPSTWCGSGRSCCR